MYFHLISMFNSGKMLPPQLNLVLEIEFASPRWPCAPASARASLSKSLIFSFPSEPPRAQFSILAGSTSYNVNVARAFTKMLSFLRRSTRPERITFRTLCRFSFSSMLANHVD